jgi:hypothetical protein
MRSDYGSFIPEREWGQPDPEPRNNPCTFDYDRLFEYEKLLEKWSAGE